MIVPKVFFKYDLSSQGFRQTALPRNPEILSKISVNPCNSSHVTTSATFFCSIQQRLKAAQIAAVRKQSASQDLFALVFHFILSKYFNEKKFFKKLALSCLEC